jgi:hypothetical protein
MTGSVRNLFMASQTQARVAHVVWQIAKIYFRVAYENGNIRPETYDEIKFDLDENEGRDITYVAKLFRNRYKFFKNSFEESSGNLLYIIRCVVADDAQILKNSPKLTHKNIQTLYDNLRELDPLIQNLRYYRNYFSHNFNDKENLGWSGSVLLSVIRLFEVALLEKKENEKNQLIMKLFRNELESLFQESLASSPEITLEEDNEIDSKKFEHIIDEIKASNSQILKRLDDLVLEASTFRGKQTQKSNQETQNSGNIGHQTSSVNQEGVEEEPVDDYVDIEFSEESNLSPEILRQELSLISEKIKEEYGSQRGFGASANLLQIANIGAIFEHEPQTCQDFLNLEIVKSRIDFDLSIIKAQIAQYENKIDELLASVLWVSAFEV